MARTNKYASLNFNDIYEKKNINPNSKRPSSSSTSASSSSPSSSFPNSSKTIISNSRIHGSMLVLSRPSPKPIVQPTPPPPSSIPDQIRFEEDSISLRPQGRTGAGPAIPSSPLTSPKPDQELPLSPKPDRFVPPHLRPGFAGREERLQVEFQKPQGVRAKDSGGHRPGNFGSPNRYGEEGRPKSGGGYERMRRIGEPDLIEINRPDSSGSRPNSSG